MPENEKALKVGIACLIQAGFDEEALVDALAKALMKQTAKPHWTSPEAQRALRERMNGYAKQKQMAAL
jgi:hypothetical protein